MAQPVEPESTPTTGGISGQTKLIAGIIVAVLVVGITSGVVYVLSQGPTSVAGIIKVGFSISLTGQFNVEGKNSLNGIVTAAKWINDHGGVQVNGKAYGLDLDYYDDASDPVSVGNLYARIITQDNAEFLLAPYSSALTGAAAPLADTYDRILLSHGGSSNILWTKGYRNLVMVLSPATTYLRGPLDWIKANHPTDRIAFLYADDAFSIVAGRTAVAYAGQLNLAIASNQTYANKGTTDLRTQLNAAKAAGADDLIGGGHFQDGQLMVSQLSAVNWKPKMISLLVAVTEPSFQSGLAAANNVTGPSQWESAVNYTQALATSQGFTWYGPSSADFTTLYTSQHPGLAPTYHSGEAAGSLLILTKAIETANSLNTTAVRQALATMKAMTFFGGFQVDSTGLQIAHTMVLVQWQDGQLKVVQPANVAQSSVRYPYTGA
jgi:branched-chain amino acid transport system substrate-binding protein